jgi:hypothetical protein
MANGKKGIVASRAKQLVAGTKKHFSNASSLAFGGGTYTPAQVDASLQTLADLRTAVDDARAAIKAKIAEERAQAPSLRNLLFAYTTFVKATFGDSPDVLADFGLKPKKVPTPLTVDQKAAASAKRAATRAARHTMGSKQKQELKGTVTTIVNPKAPAPATPPVAQIPAPSAPTQGTGGAGTPHAS